MKATREISVSQKDPGFLNSLCTEGQSSLASRKNMTGFSKDVGIATVLLMRFTTQRLPRLLGIKERVGRGERLEDWDIEFLHELFQAAEQIKPMFDRLPEYQEVYARAALLCKEITTQALTNELEGA